MEVTQISKKEFDLFKKYIYDNTGIRLADHKATLLKTRLSKRLRELNLNSFEEYYEYLGSNQAEYIKFVNAISTNVTSFFREARQWEFLTKEIQDIKDRTVGKKLRVWSAACSTGEEPYTIGMFLKKEMEGFEDFDIKILASDISHEALTKAKKGIYQAKDINDLPKHHITNNFNRIGKTDNYRIDDELADLVMFREFNLVYGDYSLFGKTQFDLIFCRNVMIYFDNDTKRDIVQNLAKKLKKGGYLFIGHSESLMTHEGLKYVVPSIYKKI